MALGFRFQDHLDTLTAEGQGGILLDAEGAVLAMNAVTSLGDGLSVVGDRLRAAYPAEQGALDRAVAIATSRAAPHELPPPAAAILH